MTRTASLDRRKPARKSVAILTATSIALPWTASPAAAVDPVTAMTLASGVIRTFAQTPDMGLVYDQATYKLTAETLMAVQDLQSLVVDTMGYVRREHDITREHITVTLYKDAASPVLEALIFLADKNRTDHKISLGEYEIIQEQLPALELTMARLAAGNLSVTGPAVGLFPFVHISYKEALGESASELEAWRQVHIERLSNLLSLSADDPRSIEHMNQQLYASRKALRLELDRNRDFHRSLSRAVDKASRLAQNEGLGGTAKVSVNLYRTSVWDEVTEEICETILQPEAGGPMADCYPVTRDVFRHNLCFRAVVTATYKGNSAYRLKLSRDGWSKHCGNRRSSRAYMTAAESFTKDQLVDKWRSDIVNIRRTLAGIDNIGEGLIYVASVQNFLEDSILALENYGADGAAMRQQARAVALSRANVLADIKSSQSENAIENYRADVQRRRQNALSSIATAEAQLEEVRQQIEKKKPLVDLANALEMGATLYRLGEALAPYVEALVETIGSAGEVTRREEEQAVTIAQETVGGAASEDDANDSNDPTIANEGALETDVADLEALQTALDPDARQAEIVELVEVLKNDPHISPEPEQIDGAGARGLKDLRTMISGDGAEKYMSERQISDSEPAMSALMAQLPGIGKRWMAALKPSIADSATIAEDPVRAERIVLALELTSALAERASYRAARAAAAQMDAEQEEAEMEDAPQ